MKKLITVFLFVLPCFIQLLPQGNMGSILDEIEKNHTGLQVLRLELEGEKFGLKTGLNPNDPEIGINQLWGNPEELGTRQDFSLVQSFDFPTSYIYRRQISGMKKEQLENRYQKRRREVRTEAGRILIDIAWLEVRLKEYNERLDHAIKLAGAWEKSFQKGEAGVLDYNKAKLNLLTIRKEVESIRIEIDFNMSVLSRMNGGKELVFNKQDNSIAFIPGDFESWYSENFSSNPELNWKIKESEILGREIKLQKADRLPAFHTGYMSESVAGEAFRGVTFGLSIPLWEDRNQVKYAKSKLDASEAGLEDYRIQHHLYYQDLYNKAVALRRNILDYRNQLERFDQRDLLELAYSKGEISMIEYILELKVYYQGKEELMEMERDLNKILLDLYEGV